jgi:hypothetical protein
VIGTVITIHGEVATWLIAAGTILLAGGTIVVAVAAWRALGQLKVAVAQFEEVKRDPTSKSSQPWAAGGRAAR